jgi:hypothetical protein
MSLQNSVFPLKEGNDQPRAAENENNIPRIMGSLALAPYSKLSWTIYLALD